MRAAVGGVLDASGRVEMMYFYFHLRPKAKIEWQDRVVLECSKSARPGVHHG